MLFSSVTFIYLFLPITLIGYFVIFRKHRTAQNIFLLLASLLFYAWGEPKFVLVMSASIILNWMLGLLVGNAKMRGNTAVARIYVALACVLNLGLLFVFKYLGFVAGIFSSLSGIGLYVPEIALPIGISFFTFQALSYVIDVYRDKGELQKNILNVGLYISFFPQLIAGPIVRYETVADEIKNRKETFSDFTSGFARFIVGLSKKVLLANSFGLLADKVFAQSTAGCVSAALAWLGAIGYTLQIFFDFCGYSDMAIGLGKMFGFHFEENFDYPYISKSITEFWRRWHISLGTWFRDYVYIPLGGSRVGKVRLVLNIFAVWSLTGIWHGANMTFVVWGLMYFVLLMAEKLSGILHKKGLAASVFGHIYTLFFVIIGWVIFRAKSLSAAWEYILSMFGRHGASEPAFFAYFSQNTLLLAVGAVLSAPVARLIPKKVSDSAVGEICGALALIALFVLCVASLASSSYNPFIYFNF